MNAACAQREARRHRPRPHEGAPAFTLIELLVVISIISLLVSVLLPAMKTAREHAKRAVCRSNMRNVNLALITYVNEFDAYPVLFQQRDDCCNCVSWATWSFGGWSGRDFNTWCNSEGEGTFCYQTSERLLSVYLTMPGTLAPDSPGDDGLYGTPDDRIEEMPAFRCPSDTESTQWRWKYGDSWASADVPYSVREMSAYEQVGTSFQMNYYWFYQAKARAEVPTGDCYYARWWGEAFNIGLRLWRGADEVGGASRFVTLVEDPFDWGVAQDLWFSANADAGPDFVHSYTGMQVMGFHGQWSRHMMAFLDGHVDWLQADTRYQRDTMWTVTNEDWYDTRRRENCPDGGEP